MEDFIKIFKSAKGDVYHITLSEEYGILSPEAIKTLGDVILLGIDLRRLVGENVTGHEVLSVIESTIAEYFLEHENVMICYYCDFINPIPRTSKNAMPPQEYRSRLFDKMFQRYTRLHGINNVRLSVVEINGIAEKYFFHLIFREAHTKLAALIGSDLKDGFDK